MSRALLVLAGRDERQRAARWVMQAPLNTRVEFKAPRRSLDQNAKLWACLTDVSGQVEWYMLDELAVNRQLNGPTAALKDAEGFARACFAHIQTAQGPAYLVRFLQSEIRNGISRVARDGEIARGRP